MIGIEDCWYVPMRMLQITKWFLLIPKILQKKTGKLIIPERKELLESVGLAGHKLFLTYLQDASSRVYQTNYSGNLEREIKLPELALPAVLVVMQMIKKFSTAILHLIILLQFSGIILPPGKLIFSGRVKRK